ncbi:MAG: penicillin-binding transpeptidase domain-containing protein, partial [Chthoniobacterales bacterium]
AVGWDKAMAEGYRIHTSLDADLQRVAEESLAKHLDEVEKTPGYKHPTYADFAAKFKIAKQKGKIDPNDTPDYLQGAVIALNNATGGILALVGGRNFEHSQYNRALQSKRPAGTAMTPFVFAVAFEKGFFPGTVVEDSALDNRAVMIGGTTGILGEWGPENPNNRYEGPITAREALAKSKNGATVRLGMLAGVDAVLQLCKLDGIKSALRPYPATFLGSSVVTLAELALAYTSFPNGGWRPDGTFILDRIEAKDGSIVWSSEKKEKRDQVMKPETAYEVHSCLVDALEKGTGAVAREKFGLKQFPAAGKTGTAYDFTDVVFAGYDSAITVAVRAGFDKAQKIYRGAFGSEIALPIWVDVMNAAEERYPAKPIPQPEVVKTVEICASSGLLATDKCPRDKVYRELATKGQMPTEPCNVHGDARTRIVRDLPDAGVPRAALAVDTEQVKPVAVQGPTLLADNDPYHAVRSTAKPPAPPDATNNEVKPETPATTSQNGIAPEDDPTILRAQPVEPGDKTPREEEPLRAEPVLRAQPVEPTPEIPRAEPVPQASVPRAQALAA